MDKNFPYICVLEFQDKESAISFKEELKERVHTTQQIFIRRNNLAFDDREN